MTDGIAVTTTADVVQQSDNDAGDGRTRITLDVAMKRVGVGRSTMNRWRRREWLHSHRMPGAGRRVHVDAEQLRALVQPAGTHLVIDLGERVG